MVLYWYQYIYPARITAQANAAQPRMNAVPPIGATSAEPFLPRQRERIKAA